MALSAFIVESRNVLARHPAGVGRAQARLAPANPQRPCPTVPERITANFLPLPKCRLSDALASCW